MKSWTLTVEEDSNTGEFYIEFTDEILKESGFSVGDYLYWTDNNDGSYTLSKEPLTTFIKKGIM
jgi:hypothetical protein